MWKTIKKFFSGGKRVRTTMRRRRRSMRGGAKKPKVKSWSTFEKSGSMGPIRYK